MSDHTRWNEHPCPWVGFSWSVCISTLHQESGGGTLSPQGNVPSLQQVAQLLGLA